MQHLMTFSGAPQPVAEEALAFQPDEVALDEQPLPRAARRVTHLVLALLAAAVAWASLAHVDRSVSAHGRLVPATPPVPVQPLGGGVLQRLDARPGDVVRAGQVLATLDPTFSRADLIQARQRLGGLTAEVTRLEAELASRPYEPPPGGSPEERLQARLYAARRAEYAASLAARDGTVARVAASLAANEGEQKRLRQQRQFAAEREAIDARLYARGAGSYDQLRQSRQELHRIGSAGEGLKEARRELERDREARRAERDSFVAGWRRRAAEELVTARRERDKLIQESAKAERVNDLLVLRAPVDAIVLEVAQKVPGSVVREGEGLLTLVPLGVPLEVEIDLPSDEVGRIKTGDPVRVKLDAFPFQRHGTLSGEVRVISADAFPRGDAPADGQPGGARAIYRVRAEVTANSLRDVPAGYRPPVGGPSGQSVTAGLRPGMTVSAEIKTGRRRVISYFFDPILRALDESLHEPH